MKHTHTKKAEPLSADTTQSKTVSQVAENFLSEDNLKTIWNVVSEIRKTLLGNKWKFEGDTINYDTPNLLQTFLKWVLLGPYKQRKRMYLTSTY